MYIHTVVALVACPAWSINIRRQLKSPGIYLFDYHVLTVIQIFKADYYAQT